MEILLGIIILAIFVVIGHKISYYMVMMQLDKAITETGLLETVNKEGIMSCETYMTINKYLAQTYGYTYNNVFDILMVMVDLRKHKNDKYNMK